MTYKQFLAALRKTPRTWKLIDQGYALRSIRCTGLRCPLSVVFPKPYPRDREGIFRLPNPTVFAEVTGLDTQIAFRIAAVADGMAKYPSIRCDLLSACGLKERQ